MSYSIKEQSTDSNEEVEYVVVDNSGTLVPPPNTFSSKAAAFSRKAALEQEEVLKLADQLKAKSPSLGVRYSGKIVAICDSLLIQDVGREKYIIHSRANAEELSDIKIGESVEIIDGSAKRQQNRGSELSM